MNSQFLSGKFGAFLKRDNLHENPEDSRLLIPLCFLLEATMSQCGSRDTRLYSSVMIHEPCCCGAEAQTSAPKKSHPQQLHSLSLYPEPDSRRVLECKYEGWLV